MEGIVRVEEEFVFCDGECGGGCECGGGVECRVSRVFGEVEGNYVSWGVVVWVCCVGGGYYGVLRLVCG